jgi:hypothetical protein
MSAKAKSKRPAAQEEEDPDVDDVPVPKPSKKKDTSSSVPPKKKAKATAEPTAPDPEPEDDPEHDEEEAEQEEELSPEEAKKRAKDVSKKRRKAKLVGYRTLAKTAGYLNVNTEGEILPMGTDCLASLLSEADAKRLMHFVPTTPGAIGFKSTEFNNRMELFKQSVPGSAARETQARCDAVLRAAMNQAVMRAVEAGKKTVSASMMASVLRPYAANMEFTAVVPPIGLVRYGQDIGVLNAANEADVKKRTEEKKEANVNKKVAVDYAEAVEKGKAAKKAHKENAKSAAQAALVAS